MKKIPVRLLAETALFEKQKVCTVNIGHRQDGRVYGNSVFNVECTDTQITGAMQRAEAFQSTEIENPYYMPDTAKRYYEKTMELLKHPQNEVKTFYDISIDWTANYKVAPSFETYQRMHQALQLIESGEIDQLDFGRHDLTEKIYVNVMEYETKETSFLNCIISTLRSIISLLGLSR